LNQYNPYAAPVAQHAAPQGPPPVGAPEPWSVGEVYSKGWDLFKIHWAPLTLGYFVSALISAVPGQIPTVLGMIGILQPGTTSFVLASLPFTLVGTLLSMFFLAGLIRGALKAVRGQTPTIGDFFSGDRFLPFLGVTFLSTLAVLVGALFLVVPGIILAVGFFNAPFYVIDQRMGPIEALKASWDSTSGQRLEIFGFSLLSGLVVIGGMLACCIGYLPAYVFTMVASTILYTRMSGTAGGSPNSFGPPMGPGGYGGPPGGGYGGPPPGGFGGPPPGGGYGPPGGGYGGPPGY